MKFRVYRDRVRSEMILNYHVIVERYPFPNAVVGGSKPTVRSSIYLTEAKNEKEEAKEKNKPTNQQNKLNLNLIFFKKKTS